MPSRSMALPDRTQVGDLSKIRAGQLLDFIIQAHRAQRAGLHNDFRFGSPELGLFSWASKKDLPEPGKRHAWFQQPLHSHAYGDFEGSLHGYGAGEVRRKRKGKISIVSAAPDRVEFTTDEEQPQRFRLIRPQTFKDKQWLVLNVTPKPSPVLQSTTPDVVEPEPESWMKRSAELDEPEEPPATVAVDLDGTLAENLEVFDPEKIGEPRKGAKAAMDDFAELGWRIIIFTVRGDKKLVGDWLKKHEIAYDYINENPDQPLDASGKVIADLYIDDRGLNADQSWIKILVEAKRRMANVAEATFQEHRTYDPVCPHCGEVMGEKSYIPDYDADTDTCSGKYRHRGDCYDKGPFEINWPQQKESAESVLPYRDRIEMFGLKDGKLLGGYYDTDKNHGVFGGGIEPGEDPAEAGAREFVEEAGYHLKNPRLLPVDPVTFDWKPPYASPMQAEKAKTYRGSRTFFGTGEVGDPAADELRGEDRYTGLKNVRFRSLLTALRHVNVRRAYNVEAAKRRRQALRYLIQQQSKQAAETPFWQRALQAQAYSPSWNANQGLLQNLMTNLQQWHGRGKAMVDEARNTRAMQTTTNAQRWQQLNQFLNHGDQIVKNPIDRLAFSPESL